MIIQEAIKSGRPFRRKTWARFDTKDLQDWYVKKSKLAIIKDDGIVRFFGLI